MMFKLRSFIVCSLLVAAGCSPDLSDDAMRYAPFPDIVINLNLPEYNALKAKGYQNISGGVRGIIVYRLSTSQYYAIEQNCSYRPNDACATVNVHPTGLYLVDDCCGSQFDFNGEPTGGGLAWRPLRRYQTILEGTMLTITDKIAD